MSFAACCGLSSDVADITAPAFTAVFEDGGDGIPGYWNSAEASLDEEGPPLALNITSSAEPNAVVAYTIEDSAGGQSSASGRLLEGSRVTTLGDVELLLEGTLTLTSVTVTDAAGNPSMIQPLDSVVLGKRVCPASSGPL